MAPTPHVQSVAMCAACWTDVSCRHEINVKGLKQCYYQFSMGDETKEHVFNMLMKNFNRTYHGEADELGMFVPGSRAPWGAYMHAAWFFGEQLWHYEGYKMFIEVRLVSSN